MFYSVLSRLTSQEQLRTAASRPVDREAYEAYLKGRSYSNKRTEGSLKRERYDVANTAVATHPRTLIVITFLLRTQVLPRTLRYES